MGPVYVAETPHFRKLIRHEFPLLKLELTFMVFENKLLSKTDASKREETTGLRKLHIQGLHNLNSSHNIIRVINSSKNEMGTTCRIYKGDEKQFRGKK
jgi:hypothetical protein